MRASVVVIGSGIGLFALGCGGAGSVPEPPATGPMPSLLVFDPTGGCSWTIVDEKGVRRTIAKTSDCPDEAWFSPDFERAMALGGGKVWHGPLDALVEVVAPAGAEALWPIEGKPALGKLDYGSGDIQLVTWALEGPAFVESGKHPVSEVDLMMNPLADHPKSPSDAGWISVGSLVDANQATAVTSVPSVELKQALRITDDPQAEVGQLWVGGTMLTYPTVFGDSLHAVPPIVICPDAACRSHTELRGDLPSQLGIVTRDRWFLVTAEYTGADPRVYVAGHEDPVYEGPAGARAVWAPAGLVP